MGLWQPFSHVKIGMPKQTKINLEISLKLRKKIKTTGTHRNQSWIHKSQLFCHKKKDELCCVLQLKRFRCMHPEGERELSIFKALLKKSPASCQGRA